MQQELCEGDLSRQTRTRTPNTRTRTPQHQAGIMSA